MLHSISNALRFAALCTSQNSAIEVAGFGEVLFHMAKKIYYEN